MNVFFAAYCRIFQKALHLVACFLNWREPVLHKGQSALAVIPDILRTEGLQKPLIVTDAGLKKLGMLEKVTQPLIDQNIPFAVFADTVPNPTIENIDSAAALFRGEGCDCLVALGGGSPMDCAKATGALIANPNRTIRQMRGLLKVRRQIPMLIAIPTTAGTGSEATLAAVVSDHVTREKYALNDTVLIPRYAVLDPALTVGLPPHITADTGLDALTHAVEAYIGKENTKQTACYALEAAQLVESNLLTVYKDGADIQARECMQHAAYLAGVSFTRAYVGAVHGIAHTLGAHYNIAHGLACAVTLPYVLEFYGKAAWKRLADVADSMGIGGTTDADKAKKLIAHVRSLNKSMGIPAHIDGVKEKDVEEMAVMAFKETNPLYPTPVILSKDDFATLIKQVGKLDLGGKDESRSQVSE